MIKALSAFEDLNNLTNDEVTEAMWGKYLELRAFRGAHDADADTEPVTNKVWVLKCFADIFKIKPYGAAERALLELMMIAHHVSASNDRCAKDLIDKIKSEPDRAHKVVLIEQPQKLVWADDGACDVGYYIQEPGDSTEATLINIEIPTPLPKDMYKQLYIKFFHKFAHE